MYRIFGLGLRIEQQSRQNGAEVSAVTLDAKTFPCLEGSGTYQSETFILDSGWRDLHAIGWESLQNISYDPGSPLTGTAP